MEKKKSWHYEIDFRCSFGIWPFKKTLEITPKGFYWCGELIPMKDITRLRWGVDLRRGGVFPKRVYAAVFGTSEKEYTINKLPNSLKNNLLKNAKYCIFLQIRF